MQITHDAPKATDSMYLPEYRTLKEAASRKYPSTQQMTDRHISHLQNMMDLYCDTSSYKYIAFVAF